MIHPAIRDLLQSQARHPAFQELLRRLPQPGRHTLAGLTTTAKALYATLLYQVTERPLLLITDGSKEAEAIFEAVETFFDLLVQPSQRGVPQLLPAIDALPLQGISPHAEILEQRAIGLWRLALGKVPITVLPAASALLKVETPGFYRQLALTLRPGDEVPLDDLIAHLISIGYEKREPVELVGEYSVRGGILDVFSPESLKPVRIDLFGDTIDTIRHFDVQSQRSVLKVEECT